MSSIVLESANFPMQPVKRLTEPREGVEAVLYRVKSCCDANLGGIAGDLVRRTNGWSKAPKIGEFNMDLNFSRPFIFLDCLRMYWLLIGLGIDALYRDLNSSIICPKGT